jgi:predicted kinase
MRQLILLRGLPGSGKSTFAKNYALNIDGIHLEADMFFTDKETGAYVFDPSKLRYAHEWCQERVESFMKHGAQPIIVTNTFTQEWEMQPYFDMAEKYDYMVHSFIAENRHNGVNEHGVPAEKLEQMKNRFNIKLI